MKSGTKAVSFGGGEPLEYPDLFRSITPQEMAKVAGRKPFQYE
ncbi:hypothetical protein cce_4331 [Crocosphaera subtropica ATCC 51142]|uniref:Uncharacterized protein n=1 Tax=Crocosphaera subtropica (strain ATCC 51142 / BH68) TaxID=43989 RepID=B1WTG4_CROS5|nr:hypothetical protein [Crocosphaera subtropica]ACB53679.1 hypothetical protein cce_4331 [Crocosphaera subtropica ATCC 51142]